MNEPRTVLEVPKEEHLDAELAGLLVEGENIRLLDALGVDALHPLDRRERGDPVPVAGGALELESLGGLLHLGPHPVLHGVRLAGEERPGRIRHGGIILLGDLARAGAGAALDLIEQAGPGAVLVITVGAGAQQEGALQGVDRPVDRPDAGERPVIIALPAPCAAMLDDLRGGPVGGDQDVGERLVVPHQHVEAGLQLLDQVGFEQQRFGLGRGGDELHRRRLRDHPGDAVRMGLPAGVGADPGLQVLGLADVEDVAAMVEHPVHAGRGRQGRPEAADYLGSGFDGARLEVEVDFGRRILRQRGLRLVGGLLPLGVAAVVERVGGQV
jgi:hypothetical protein